MTSSEELQGKTLTYWRLSSLVRGKHDMDISCGQALEICNAIYYETAPDRPIRKLINNIQNAIIHGGLPKQKRTKKNSAKVIAISLSKSHLG